jgi:hypothetical protein
VGKAAQRAINMDGDFSSAADDVVTRSFSSATTSSSFCAIPTSRRYFSALSHAVDEVIVATLRKRGGLIYKNIAPIPHRSEDEPGTEYRLDRQRSCNRACEGNPLGAPNVGLSCFNRTISVSIW